MPKAEGEMTQARITVMTLATACLLAGCFATTEAYREMPDSMGRHVTEKGVEACSQPGGQGECSIIKNVRLTLVGFQNIGGVSFSKEALPDGGNVWVKTQNMISLHTDETLAREQAEKQKALAEKQDCDRRGGVKIGMSDAQVLKSCWGKPKSVNETITAHGAHQQWVYGGGYLYLDDGVVTSIQTRQ
jgi:hypothetical protein